MIEMKALSVRPCRGLSSVAKTIQRMFLMTRKAHRSVYAFFFLALLGGLCSCDSQKDPSSLQQGQIGIDYSLRSEEKETLIPREAALAANRQFSEQLSQTYSQYRDGSVLHQRFTLSDIQPVIDRLPAAFTVSEAGQSVERRRINRVTWGKGPTQVLLWSQMHGDEPTATAALLDIFRWLAAENDGQDSIRQRLSEQLTLTFLPMLNPDGAQRFTRHNALHIDLNRDALRLSSPESAILKSERDRLQADWGFNLHDQSRYYGVGFPPAQVAALSILAPAYNWEKNVNQQRREAIQLIALMNRTWQQAVPGGVGRYNDDFEPRAFGDNLQKWGTRTILIESGGSATDWEKQDLRKLNFVGILAGLHGIVSQAYQAISSEEYWQIPENSYNAFHDLIIRNASIKIEGKNRLVDIAIRQEQRVLKSKKHQYYFDASITDLGDLHTFRGFREIDGSGLVARPGKTYPQAVSRERLSGLDFSALRREGYTAIPVIGLQEVDKVAHAGARLLPERSKAHQGIFPGQRTDLLLYRGENLEKTVILGELY